MREIKFRAYDKDEKRMIDWQYLIDYCDIDYLFGNYMLTEKRDTVPNFVVMQYINFIDKNKKEVYEGDIVRVVYNGTMYIKQVVFDESELDFKATNGKKEYGKHFVYLPCCEEVEVIGNIYENPNLLSDTN